MLNDYILVDRPAIRAAVSAKPKALKLKLVKTKHKIGHAIPKVTVTRKTTY